MRHIFIKTKGEHVKVDVREITHVEAGGDYMFVHTKGNERYIVKQTMSKLKSLLPDTFVQTHRSYLVNTTLIYKFNSDRVRINHVSIPISRTFKKNLLTSLEILR